MQWCQAATPDGVPDTVSMEAVDDTDLRTTMRRDERGRFHRVDDHHPPGVIKKGDGSRLLDGRRLPHARTVPPRTGDGEVVRTSNPNLRDAARPNLIARVVLPLNHRDTAVTGEAVPRRWIRRIRIDCSTPGELPAVVRNPSLNVHPRDSADLRRRDRACEIDPVPCGADDKIAPVAERGYTARADAALAAPEPGQTIFGMDCAAHTALTSSEGHRSVVDVIEQIHEKIAPGADDGIIAVGKRHDTTGTDHRIGAHIHIRSTLGTRLHLTDEAVGFIDRRAVAARSGIRYSSPLIDPSRRAAAVGI